MGAAPVKLIECSRFRFRYQLDLAKGDYNDQFEARLLANGRSISRQVYPKNQSTRRKQRLLFHKLFRAETGSEFWGPGFVQNTVRDSENAKRKTQLGRKRDFTAK